QHDLAVAPHFLAFGGAVFDVVHLAQRTERSAELALQLDDFFGKPLRRDRKRPLHRFAPFFATGFFFAAACFFAGPRSPVPGPRFFPGPWSPVPGPRSIRLTTLSNSAIFRCAASTSVRVGMFNCAAACSTWPCTAWRSFICALTMAPYDLRNSGDSATSA